MAINQVYSAWDTLQSVNLIAVTATPQQISGGAIGLNLPALGNKPANNYRVALVLYNPTGGQAVQLSTDSAGLDIFMVIPAGNLPVTIPAKRSFPIWIATASSTATVTCLEIG